jgi:hypothetical protein
VVVEYCQGQCWYHACDREPLLYDTLYWDEVK